MNLENINMDNNNEQILNMFQFLMNGGQARVSEEDLLNQEICNSHMVQLIKDIRSKDKVTYTDEYKYNTITNNLGQMVVNYWQENGNLPEEKHIDELCYHCVMYMYRNRPCDCIINA